MKNKHGLIFGFNFCFACLSLAGLLIAGLTHAESHETPFHSLFMAVEDLRPDRGSLGSGPIHSQKIDRLVDEAVAKCKLTLPSRLTLARPFGNHMVLQANQPIRLWGKAKPLAVVQAQFLGKSDSTQADDNGDWRIELPQHNQYEKKGRKLTVSAASNRVVLHDVLVGEVWICAGQSNMEWELRKSANAKEAIANAPDSLMRLHHCPGGARGTSGVYSEKQIRCLWPEAFSEGSWKVASTVSAAEFSAVGFYFGKRLRQKLDVPVGLINVAVGGTPIESWVSSNRLKSNAELARMFNGNWLENPLLDEWCRRRATANLKRGLSRELEIPGDEYGPNHSFKPGFMHSAGIQPFAPMSIRGAIWYQGESNGDSLDRIKIYDACFPLLVDDWRHHFRNQKLSVVFVQLPGMGRPYWPVFREYQRRSLEKLTNVGMAITIDTGHPTNVHPTEKSPVGNRLAQWALVQVYSRPGTSIGPMFKSHKIKGNAIELTFDTSDSGLRTSDGQMPNHFEVAGGDGEFHPASAKIVDGRILVASRLVPRPINARYAWVAYPQPAPNLVNSAGLPASPFTTQDEFH